MTQEQLDIIEYLSIAPYLKIDSPPDLYKKADFYLKRENQSSTWIGYKELPEFENNILLAEAQAGNYTFYVILTDHQNKTTQTQEIRVSILD